MYRELFGFRSRGEPGTRWAEVALVGGRSRVYIWKRGCRCAGVIARIEPPGALSSHNKSAGHSPGSALPPSSFHGPWPVLVIIAQRAHVARRFVHPAMLHTRDPTESRLDSSRHLFPPPVIRPTRALETGLVTGGTADLHRSEVAYRRHGGWTGSVADSGGRVSVSPTAAWLPFPLLHVSNRCPMSRCPPVHYDYFPVIDAILAASC